MFLASWWGQFLAMLAEPGRFVPAEFWEATFENWQSEFFQLFFQAILIASWWGQSRFFRADGSADKGDVDKILVAISKVKGNQ
jgi:hypothetical protein